MKERINRLAKGIIDSELPRMIWSPEIIEETLRMNGIVRRELLIGSENGLNVKGFVYSSHSRVRIPNDNNTFGGLRCRMVYEVDTSFLTAGDEIEGSFFLVTNCGEKEIPFQFHVDMAASGQILGDLHTAEDFRGVAEHDMDTALRLLEYPDFPEAPFMQDLHVRAIYDGLKGHGNRQNFMEEFLVALGVKQPIRLMVEDQKKTYQNVTGRVDDAVTIRIDTWGYLYLEASADGDFIHLPQKSATQAEFVDGVFRLPFGILAERLHAGKNFGTVSIKTARGITRVPVEVTMNSGERDRSKMAFREEFGRYLEARLEYESGMYGEGVALNRMQKELDLMKMMRDDPILKLLQAEIYLLTDRKEKACLILDEIRDRALTSRTEDPKAYCLFQYLQVCLREDSEQRDSLIRLLQRHASEGDGDLFYYLMLLRTDEALTQNPMTLLISMEQEFKDGCCSPFLYVEGLKLLEQEPSLLENMGAFELHALYYGAKRGMISRELALRTAGILGGSRSGKSLYRKLLEALYGKYPERAILEALCAVMIRENLRGTPWFSWYSKAVAEGIQLTRLYEYFLYALPSDYGKQMPQEVLLYFSYSAQLDAESRARLYGNILSYSDPSSEIYRMYEREMEQFTVEQLLAGRMDGCLAVLYQKLVYREMIDGQLARVLPGILKSNRICCKDAAMRYVVVRHEELMTEDAYPLKDGAAYVPLFSERDVILFQDAYGSRYVNVRFEKEPAMEENEELLAACFEMDPGHPFLFVNACFRVMEQETLGKDEAALLETADRKMKLHPLLRARILSAIVGYYRKKANGMDAESRDGSISDLLCVERDTLTREERNGVCETLIRQNYFNEAYEMVCRYGLEGLSVSILLKLCTKMVLERLFDEDDRLLFLAWYIFCREKSDSVTLDYLCEHFNGTVEQMYRVLLQGIKEHVETYDLEERLVAQMLFTGDTKKLDRVFEFYASRKKTNESVVRAYFTVKSAEYFLEGKPTQDQVFSYLEGAVHGSAEKDKVPDIYLLALTKYYSTLPDLDEEQKSLCQTVVDVLLEAGMVFAYFKDLARFIVIPGDILDKEIIEYHGKKEVRPYLRLRILPEEEEYHYEEMRPVYRGIYVREKVLFEGEILEFQIEEEEMGERVLRAEGSIACREVETRSPGNRFACLNEMSLSLEVKNEAALREKMEEYVKKDAAVAELFPLQ
mgnify:FL=1